MFLSLEDPVEDMLTIKNSPQKAILGAIVTLCGQLTPAVNGQQISSQEFAAALRRGIAHEEAWAGKAFRFEKTEVWHSTKPIEIIEVRGSEQIRVRHFVPGTDALESETVIIGENIHERSGTSIWRTLTVKDLALERKAQREAMSQALVAADNKKYRDVASAMVGSTTAAVIRAHRNYYFAVTNIPENAVFDHWGKRTENGQDLRVYTASGSIRKFSSTEPDLRECLVNITYWFDATTGTLAKAQTRFEWVYSYGTRSYTTILEWRLDPDIKITEPVTAAK